MSEPTKIAGANGSDEILRQQLFQSAVQNVQVAQKRDASTTAEAVQASEGSDNQDSSALTEDEQKALKEAIQHLDQLVKPLSIGLSVQRIDTINRLYVQLLDRQTGETIREIPPRKILEMQENIKAFQGLLFDKFS